MKATICFLLAMLMVLVAWRLEGMESAAPLLILFGILIAMPLSLIIVAGTARQRYRDSDVEILPPCPSYRESQLARREDELKQREDAIAEREVVLVQPTPTVYSWELLELKEAGDD